MAIEGKGLLTQRESEIATLAATGKTCGEIATNLCLSVNTVKTHLRHIYAKAGVANRVQLHVFLTPIP